MQQFPKYLEDNAEKLSAEDKERYSSQSRIVAEVITIYEDPAYSADNQEKGVKIVTLMNAVSLSLISFPLPCFLVSEWAMWVVDADARVTSYRDHGSFTAWDGTRKRRYA